MPRTIDIFVEPDGYFDDYDPNDFPDHERYDVTGDAVDSWDQYCDDGACELTVTLMDAGGSLEIHAKELPGGIFTITFPEEDNDGNPLEWEERQKRFEFTRAQIPASAIFSVRIPPAS